MVDEFGFNGCLIYFDFVGKEKYEFGMVYFGKEV